MDIVTDIVLYDVIGYSQNSSENQLRIAQFMTKSIQEVIGILRGLSGIWVKELDSDPLVLGYIPTGDGAYIILNPLFAGYGILLALSLRNHLVVMNKKTCESINCGTRFAVALGEIYPYVDIMGRVNYAGDGMNICARIGSAHKSEDFPKSFTSNNYVVSDDQASDCFQENVYRTMAEKSKARLQIIKSEIFRIKDKHGKKHNCYLYEMNRFVSLPPIRPSVFHDDGQKQQLRNLALGKLS